MLFGGRGRQRKGHSLLLLCRPRCRRRRCRRLAAASLGPDGAPLALVGVLQRETCVRDNSATRWCGARRGAGGVRGRGMPTLGNTNEMRKSNKTPWQLTPSGNEAGITINASPMYIHVHVHHASKREEHIYRQLLGRATRIGKRRNPFRGAHHYCCLFLQNSLLHIYSLRSPTRGTKSKHANGDNGAEGMYCHRCPAP